MSATIHRPSRLAAATSPLLEGARDMVPMALGILPLGLAVGAAIGASSVPRGAGWASGPIILSGAAHLLTIEMLDAGAAPWVIVLSALALNARIVMYGAAIAPWFGEESRRRRLLLAVPLIDQLYLAAGPRFAEGDLDRRGRQQYWVGAAVVLVATWLGAQAVAIGAQASLPEGLGLDVAAPLAFAGLLAKSTPDRPAVTAAAAAGLVAVVAVGLPFNSVVIIAIVAGVIAGRRIQTTPNEENGQ